MLNSLSILNCQVVTDEAQISLTSSRRQEIDWPFVKQAKETSLRRKTAALAAAASRQAVTTFDSDVSR